MSTIRDFDWVVDRVEVARWNNRSPGKRDAHVACPVHGGSDSLHVTEKNGRALVTCFAEGCTYEAVVAALEEQDGSAPAKITTHQPRPAYAPTGEKVADQIGNSWRPPLRPRKIPPGDLHGGLPTLASVPLDEAVVLTEGHGPAIALNDIGVPAVCTVTGKAGTISVVGASFLYGRRVILSPDVGGAEHMERNAPVVARMAAEVLVAPDWPEEMGDNEDAADHIRRYGADATRNFYAAAAPWEERASGDPWQWASDIAVVEPEPLLLDRWEAGQENVLFGFGGSGKGMISAHDVATTTRTHDPWAWLVLDYERHAAYEWRPRLERFGGDLGRVMVAQPTDAIWTDGARAFVAERVEHLRATFPDSPLGLLVDSIGYACGGDGIEKSETAIRYWNTVAELWQGTSIHLAHQRGENGTQRPFGSMYWENGARSTVHVSGRGHEDRILSNRKDNMRETFAPVRVPWWGTDPTSLEFRLAKLSVEFIAYDVLASQGPMSSEDLAAAVSEEREKQGQRPTTVGYIRKVLSETKDDFEKVGDAWQVRKVKVARTRPGKVTGISAEEGNKHGNDEVTDA